MLKLIDPLRFVLISLSGWMNQHHPQMIDYLREENRVLREQLAGPRLGINDTSAPDGKSQGIGAETPVRGRNHRHATV